MIVPEMPTYWGGDNKVHESMYHVYRKFVTPYEIWQSPFNPGGVLPYKGLMGTCGQPGYVFRDFCLEQGIEFIIFCLNQGIDLTIFVLNRINVLNRVSKIGILS